MEKKDALGTYFKKDSEGNTLFYPYGIFTKGRVISDEAVEAKVRSFAILYLVVGGVPTAVLANFSILWTSLWFLASVVWYSTTIRRLLSGCPYTDEKPSLKLNVAEKMAAITKTQLWLIIGIFSFLIFAGYVDITMAKTSKVLVAGIVTFVGGIAGVAFFVYVFTLRRKVKP
jgi:hypothetical protein